MLRARFGKQTIFSACGGWVVVAPDVLFIYLIYRDSLI